MVYILYIQNKQKQICLITADSTRIYRQDMWREKEGEWQRSLGGVEHCNYMVCALTIGPLDASHLATCLCRSLRERWKNVISMFLVSNHLSFLSWRTTWGIRSSVVYACRGEVLWGLQYASVHMRLLGVVLCRIHQMLLCLCVCRWPIHELDMDYWL